MANQANIDMIESGRKATAVAGAIKEYVDDQMREHVGALIAMYRNGAVGPISHDMLIGKVAEITALSNLLSDLENKGLRGDMAANREYGDAKKS